MKIKSMGIMFFLFGITIVSGNVSAESIAAGPNQVQIAGGSIPALQPSNLESGNFGGFGWNSRGFGYSKFRDVFWGLYGNLNGDQKSIQNQSTLRRVLTKESLAQLKSLKKRERNNKILSIVRGNNEGRGCLLLVGSYKKGFRCGFFSDQGRRFFKIPAGDAKLTGTLQILKAFYGDLNLSRKEKSRVIDVTRKLNVVDNQVKIEDADQFMNRIFTDPAPGIVKGLLVFYRVGENVYVRVFNEYQPVTISTQDHGDAYLLPLATASVVPDSEQMPAVAAAPVVASPVVEPAPGLVPTPGEQAPVVAPTVTPSPTVVAAAPVVASPVVEPAPGLAPTPGEQAPVVAPTATPSPTVVAAAPVVASPVVEPAPVLAPTPGEQAPVVAPTATPSPTVVAPAPVVASPVVEPAPGVAPTPGEQASVVAPTVTPSPTVVAPAPVVASPVVEPAPGVVPTPGEPAPVVAPTVTSANPELAVSIQQVKNQLAEQAIVRDQLTSEIRSNQETLATLKSQPGTLEANQAVVTALESSNVDLTTKLNTVNDDAARLQNQLLQASKQQALLQGQMQQGQSLTVGQISEQAPLATVPVAELFAPTSQARAAQTMSAQQEKASKNKGAKKAQQRKTKGRKGKKRHARKSSKKTGRNQDSKSPKTLKKNKNQKGSKKIKNKKKSKKHQRKTAA